MEVKANTKAGLASHLLITETPHSLLQKSTPVYTESAIPERGVKQSNQQLKLHYY